MAAKDNAVSSFNRIEISQELRDIGQGRIRSSNVASVAKCCMEYFSLCVLHIIACVFVMSELDIFPLSMLN